jgi:PKD repeat protein
MVLADRLRVVVLSLLAGLIAAPAAEGAYWHEKQLAGNGSVISAVAGDGSATTLGAGSSTLVWAPVSRPGELSGHPFPTVAEAPGFFPQSYALGRDLAVNSAGKALAVLQYQTPETGAVVAAVSREGGIWGPLHVLGGSASDQALAVVAPDGAATALWHSPAGLQAASRTAAGVWGQPVTLQGADASFAFNPQLVVDAAGRVTAAWLTGDVIYTATRPAGGAWSIPAAAGAPELAGPDQKSDAREFVLEAEPGGGARMLVHARTRDFDSRDQLWAMRRATSTWSAPVLLDGPGVSRPVLAVNASGQALGAWYRTDTEKGTTTLRTAGAAAGAAFGAPSDLQVKSIGSQAAVALQDTGAAMIAVHGVDDRIQYQERAAGGAFGPVQVVPRQPADTPDLDVAAGGRYLLTVARVARFTALSRPPIAAIGHSGELQRGVPYALSASGSRDPDGTISSYAWDLDGDGAYDDDADATASVTLTVTGSRTIALRVVDSSGESRVERLTLDLPPVPAAPNFTISPPAPLSGEAVTFTSTGTGPDGGASTPAQWTLNSADFNAGTSFAASPTYTYHLPGTYQVTLHTTDGSSVTKPVVIGNRPPTADFTSPGSAAARTLVEFDGFLSSDPDGAVGTAVKRYEWDLDGDGAYETDLGGYSKAVAVYGQGGTVNVGLKVTDSLGATGTTAKPFTVSGLAAARGLSSPRAATPAAVAGLVAAGARTVRFRASRAGVLSVRVLGRRRTLAAGALVFRRGGAQVLELARFSARGARVRVVWTPRRGRAITVTRSVRRGS